MGIILTILLFGVLIFIHEFGHFITAKLSGVKVNEFALGMGPVIWKTRKKDTQYALRLLPIGGFVSMEGEDEDSEEEGSFSKARIWNKILIVTAGALMNLILGFLLLVIVVSQQQAIGTTTVARFEDGATSSQMLQVDDKILKINGSSINIDYDIIYTMMRDSDGAVDMVVLRDGQKIELTGIPFSTEEMEDGTVTTTLDFKVYGSGKNGWGSAAPGIFLYRNCGKAGMDITDRHCHRQVRDQSAVRTGGGSIRRGRSKLHGTIFLFDAGSVYHH